MPTSPHLSASDPLAEDARRAVLALAVLSTLTHAGLLAYDLTHGARSLPSLGPALLISVVLTLVVALGRPDPRRLGVAVSYGTALWLVAEMLRQGLMGAALTTHFYIVAGLVALLAYTWLPSRRAGTLILAVLVALYALALTFQPGDLPNLLYLTFLIGMIAYHTQYGLRVSSERARGEWLRGLAFQDPLTGAANRRGGWAELERVLAAPATDPGAGDAAVILLDIDQFKGINDRLGHAAGDRVLVRVAQQLGAAAPGALVTRWGGEEFLILLRAVDRAQAQAVAERAVSAVRQMRLEGGEHVTVSAGLVLAREVASADAWVDLADQRMYQAKRGGGDRWA